ncbi:MAG: c-type cytochrome [Planctomycetota bacterium]
MVRLKSAVAVLLSWAPLCAQNGDKKDPPGTVQAPPPASWQIPPAPPLAPEQELQSFVIDERYRAELVAAEPLVEDPIAVVFDAHARMWVVEMRGFMPDVDGRGEDQPVGRVSVLEDRDHDGRMDHRTVFQDGLVMPRAVLPLEDGAALVIAHPSLWLCRDVDGDLKADSKASIGLDYVNGTGDPEHAANTPTFGLDGWIYLARYDHRLLWDGKEFRHEFSSMAGQFGLSPDEEGRFFSNGNSDYLRGDLASPHYGVRHPGLASPAFLNQQFDRDQEVFPSRINPGVNRGYQQGTLREDGRLWHYTGACSPVVYRGDWMPELDGEVFVAEPTGNLVRRATIHAEGSGLRGRNAYPDREFMASTDERFRPVNFANGPDGALYVVDMYRGVVQHRNYVTTYLRRQIEERGLAAPIHLGRIWRVRPRDGEARRPAVVAEADSEALVGLCIGENGHLRDLAQREIVRRGLRETAPRLRVWARELARAPSRVHALWTLSGLGALDLATLFDCIDDSDPVVRAAAARVAEDRLRAGSAWVVARVLEAARAEQEPRVALQWALSLGEVSRSAAAERAATIEALADLALRFAVEAPVRDAVLSGLRGEEIAFLSTWRADARSRAVQPGSQALLRRLAQCVARGRDGAAVVALLDVTSGTDLDWQRESLLAGLLDVLPKKAERKIGVAAIPQALERLTGLGDVEAKAAARIGEAIEVRAGAGVRLDPAAQAMVERGGALFLATCATCHQVDGNGMAGLAPPLRGSEWVLGEPAVLARIVLRGLTGPIEVRGQGYELPLMPDHAKLSDEDIAAILSHLRRAWEHEASIVDPDLIRTQRAATASRTQPFTVKELLGR